MKYTYESPDCILVESTDWQECENARVWHQYRKFSVQSELSKTLQVALQEYNILIDCPTPETIRTTDIETGLNICIHTTTQVSVSAILAWLTQEHKNK